MSKVATLTNCKFPCSNAHFIILGNSKTLFVQEYKEEL
jgi:hypothetical protein